ncbi:hypothetical protein CGJ15_25400 [Vibrio parahaemolyticus]|nr:hypothetical protein CGJ15_25400 [Vibrio parahaemolyticus]
MKSVLKHTALTMSDAYFDEYDHYNFDDKLVRSRGSGKNRSKQEAEQNKHHNDTDGHTRKIVNNMKNNEANNRTAEATAIKH